MVSRCLLLAASCVLAASCSGGSTPTGPSSNRVSGAWIGNATLTSAGGGECVGPTLQAAIGSRDVFSARIQQNGSDLAASITYQGNHTSCLYNGRTQGSSVTLDFSSCPAGRVEAFVCADGTTRALQIATTRVTAQVNGTTGTGTETTTWTVLPPGGTAPVGQLTVTSQFVWNVLGLPHNDFHIFDGSILPGYVDGVTIIPEEPNPFCLKCGWF